MHAYMLQLYFDFSGYSNMACGLGLMIGFQFVKNFDMPYTSRSITEFWRRWHISLSTWLRDYLYISLGGSRLGPLRTYINLFLVMLLGGLWHGANWTFVIWGAWHGGTLAVERATGWDRQAAKYWVSLPLTLLIVLVGWVVFRAENLSVAANVYSGMLGFNGMELTSALSLAFTREALLMLVVAVLIAVFEPWLRDLSQTEETVAIRSDGTMVAQASVALPLTILLLGVVTVLKLADSAYSPFLYFQF